MYDIPMYVAREKELSDYAESIYQKNNSTPHGGYYYLIVILIVGYVYSIL